MAFNPATAIQIGGAVLGSGILDRDEPSQSNTVDPRLTAFQLRNLGQADIARRVGYQPLYGATVAAPTQAQDALTQSLFDAGSSYGLVPEGVSPFAGRPQATVTPQGFKAYESGPQYDAYVAESRRRNPEQEALYDSVFAKGRDYNYDAGNNNKGTSGGLAESLLGNLGVGQVVSAFGGVPGLAATLAVPAIEKITGQNDIIDNPATRSVKKVFKKLGF